MSGQQAYFQKNGAKLGLVEGSADKILLFFSQIATVTDFNTDSRIQIFTNIQM